MEHQYSRRALTHLVFNLVSVGQRFVGILVWVQSSHKLIIVDVAVSVTVKDVRHRTHLQAAGREFWEIEYNTVMISLDESMPSDIPTILHSLLVSPVTCAVT